MNPNLSSGGTEAAVVGFHEADTHVRVYLSRAELTKAPIEQLPRNSGTQTKLFADLLAIPGVAMIVGKPYEVALQKADLYSWEEIHGKVMDLMFSANIGFLECPETKQ